MASPRLQPVGCPLFHCAKALTRYQTATLAYFILPISLKRFLPFIACLIAWNAQAEIINYAFTGVMKGTSPNTSKANFKTGDTFELTFSIDTNSTPTSRGPQYGTSYVNGVNILSSTLTITSASSSTVSVDLTSTTGTLALYHTYSPYSGSPYDSFMFSTSLPENTYIDQGTPTCQFSLSDRHRAQFERPSEHASHGLWR